MKPESAFLQLEFIFTRKQFLERKFITRRDWQHGAMDVRIFLVHMDIETNDILFAPFITCESVNVFGPIFDVFTSGDG